MIRSSQYGFTKGKSCLTSLIAFHDGTTGWRHEGTAVGVACLHFRKAFSKVSQDILTGELREGELDEWIGRWIENWQSSELLSVAQVEDLSLVVFPKVQH